MSFKNILRSVNSGTIVVMRVWISRLVGIGCLLLCSFVLGCKGESKESRLSWLQKSVDDPTIIKNLLPSTQTMRMVPRSKRDEANGRTIFGSTNTIDQCIESMQKDLRDFKTLDSSAPSKFGFIVLQHPEDKSNQMEIRISSDDYHLQEGERVCVQIIHKSKQLEDQLRRALNASISQVTALQARITEQKELSKPDRDYLVGLLDSPYEPVSALSANILAKAYQKHLFPGEEFLKIVAQKITPLDRFQSEPYVGLVFQSLGIGALSVEHARLVETTVNESRSCHTILPSEKEAILSCLGDTNEDYQAYSALVLLSKSSLDAASLSWAQEKIQDQQKRTRTPKAKLFWGFVKAVINERNQLVAM